jgi:hypothetical protein
MGNMKPIHKFNNEDGATLCRSCYNIITLGWSDEVICGKCKGYIESKSAKEQKEWKDLENLIDREYVFNRNNLNK